jgi:hypothetical protein
MLMEVSNDNAQRSSKDAASNATQQALWMGMVLGAMGESW